MKREAITIRRCSTNELDQAFSLIWTVFQQFTAPDCTEEGIGYFYNQFIQNQAFRNKFTTGDQIMYGAFDRRKQAPGPDHNPARKLVGVLSISKGNHISCVFVDGEYHRQGIATALFREAVFRKKESGGSRIQLNASPCGVPFYHAIGFTDTGKETEHHGIRYTPMELMLEFPPV